MKTTTHLRLSLLIPILVWGVCLLILIVWGKIAPIRPGSDGAESIIKIVLLPLMFYVYGIVGWFLPYLLLSLILLIWSFRTQAHIILKVFALSPLAMAVFVFAFLAMLSIGRGDWNTFWSSSMTSAESFFGSTLSLVILAIAWGYICVGIGYAIYELLQWTRLIRDEAITPSMPLNEPI
jgi:hypothetical protein